MVGRVKFQVQAASGRWRTVYVREVMVDANYIALTQYGFRVRIDHPHYGYVERAA